MNNKFFKLIFCLALLLSCAPSFGAKWKAKHVVFIGLDGWGAYSMEKANMPTVKQLMKDGSYTLEKRSVLPSSSAVNWASMFMGAGPELHGYTEWGSKTPELPSRVLSHYGIFPSIWGLFRDANPKAEIGFFCQWNGLEYLAEIINKLDGKVNKIKFTPELNGTYTFNSNIEDYDGIMLVSSYNGMNRRTNRFLKRSFDIVTGIAGCIVLGILYLIYAPKIKKDGGKAMFLHTRIGQYLKTFKMYKFRTMYADAEKRLEEMLSKDEKLREEYYKNFKLKNDPRVTEVGKFLRKTSLDEFPQFINVIKGEMSFVGPRPVVQKEVDMYYGEENSRKIFMVKPGITGMWQANGRSDVENYDERIALDLYYIRNWSLWLDVTITIKTIKNVIGKKGAY